MRRRMRKNFCWLLHFYTFFTSCSIFATMCSGNRVLRYSQVLLLLYVLTCYVIWNHGTIHPLNVYFMKNSLNSFCLCKFIRTLCKIMRLRYHLIPMKSQLIMLSKITSSFWWMQGLQDTSWVGLFLSEVKIMRLKLKSFENCMQVILLSLI